MTDEQINIKIAEICGWKTQIARYKNNQPVYRKPPNYAADLNACHEFEKTLDTYELAEYWHNLLRAHEHIPVCAGCSDARQRCEAFLRVHNQWEEEA
jgi:hypothetical protein